MKNTCVSQSIIIRPYYSSNFGVLSGGFEQSLQFRGELLCSDGIITLIVRVGCTWACFGVLFLALCVNRNTVEGLARQPGVAANMATEPILVPAQRFILARIHRFPFSTLSTAQAVLASCIVTFIASPARAYLNNETRQGCLHARLPMALSLIHI